MSQVTSVSFSFQRQPTSIVNIENVVFYPLPWIFLSAWVFVFLKKSELTEPICFVNFIISETKKQVTKELANKDTILGLTAKIMTFQHRHPFFHPVIRCQ